MGSPSLNTLEQARTLSLRERLAQNVRAFISQDLTALLEFRHRMYGVQSIFSDPDYVKWLYCECSYLPPPTLRLYIQDQQILGHQGVMPIHLRVNGASHLARWNCELMIHPAYRMRGYGNILNEFGNDDYACSLGLEVSDNATQAMQRSGWKLLGGADWNIRLLRPQKYLQKRFNRLWLTSIGAALEFPLRLFDKSIALFGDSRINWIPIEAFDGRVETLFSEVSQHYANIIERTASKLNWRFSKFPHRGRYFMFYMLRESKVIGYVVFRLGFKNNMRVGYLVDYLTAPEHLGQLFVFSINHMRQRGAAALYCLTINKKADPIFKRLGFHKRDSGWRFMAKCNLPELADTVYKMDKWFITAGDPNVDRPRNGTTYA
jgi:hypothetical protein